MSSRKGIATSRIGIRRGASLFRRIPRSAAALWLAVLFALPSCVGTSRETTIATASGPSESQPCDLSDDLAAKLGATLFFDARLSKDQDLACATCHDPQLSFTDQEPLAKGRGEKILARHTPALINLRSSRSFFWDGRASSLEAQARAVITNPDEFGSTFPLVVHRLASAPFYSEAFERVYPGKGIREKTILAALAAFERRIIAAESPHDRFLAGDSDVLSESAQRGFSLFNGRALCSKCHSGLELTDGRFHNTGVETEDLGRVKVVRNIDFQMRPYPFFGNHKAFKTPSLRNVDQTAPYFHNGSEATLEDVVDFYRHGGRARDDYGRSPDVRRLQLSDQDAADLVAFLRSLTSDLDFCRPTEEIFVRGRPVSPDRDYPASAAP